MDEKKVAFITGGTRGIGKAIAKIFSDNGYNLVINYVSEKTDLKKLEDDLKNDNEILFVRANVGEFDSAENAVKEAIEKFGKIDVLVNFMETPVTITTALRIRTATVAKITLCILLNFPINLADRFLFFIYASPLHIP